MSPRASELAMVVKIWGARGSVPTPVRENLGVGGNTACVEVSAGGQRLIFDAGTGIRALGMEHEQGDADPDDGLHIFLTHFHWDHVQGLPFFSPLYAAGRRVTFYSAWKAEELRAVLGGQMKAPYFPVGFEQVGAELRFVQIDGGPRAVGGGMQVSTFPLHHPGGSFGYAVACGGRKVVYATDHEHGDVALDAGLTEAARDADLLLYDAHFTPEEYAEHVGWGHSTWAEAVGVAEAARVKRLLLFHHAPGHSDDAMQDILEQARARFEATSLAVESETFVV